MTQDEVFAWVLRKLDETEFQYMVCGSVAAILYGEPRMTNDMDLVVAVLPHRAREFFQIFDSSGFYCPPVEVLEKEFRARGQFNLLHHDTGVKVDCIVLKDTPFNHEEFRRRQRVPFTETQDASLARPEDVILSKLQFYKEGGSEKHLADIRGILRVSADQIDRTYLERWAEQLRLETEWRKATSS
jgi:hypothetical protein